MQKVHELLHPMEMDTRVPAGFSAGRERRGKHLCLFEDLEGRAGLGFSQEAWKARQVVGAEHDVDIGRSLLNDALVLLRQASAHDDAQVRADVLQRFHVSQVAVQLLVGVLAYAASIEEHH